VLDLQTGQGGFGRAQDEAKRSKGRSGAADAGGAVLLSDLHKANRPVGSLDAKILKSPVRICAYCNNTRTQPHDMSDRLRSRRLAVGRWVRCNNIFGYCTKREMLNVHLFLLKLFGCMLAEAKANGYEVPIDIEPFSTAIMQGRPHAEVHLQFGRHDGIVGRSNLHCWKASRHALAMKRSRSRA
jgi:hypothetical protein